jgi:phosphatidate cytidylyltransferase
MKRILTALIMIPVVVYAVLGGIEWVFLLVLAAVAGICFDEYLTITASREPVAYAAGLFVLLAPTHWLGLFTVLFTLLMLTLAMRASDLAAGFTRSAIVVTGVIYIFGAWRTAILLREMNPWWLMFGLVVSWIGDTGAYYVGRRYGRHKLAPRVSPGKTWEGTIASAAVSTLAGALALPRLIPGVGLGEALLLALVANLAGQVGDLAESAIKRGAGVKDSGTLLPGHGGLLDRVDSSMFALPVLYAILAAKGPLTRATQAFFASKNL